MSKPRLVSTAFLASLFATLVGAASVPAADCTVLIGKTYDCREKSDYYGFVIEDEWTFSSNEDGKLSLHTAHDVDYRCTCQAKGSFANPRLNESLGFLCGGITTDAPSSIGDAISAKVTGSGKKIKGQLFRHDPSDPPDDARILECTEIP